MKATYFFLPPAGLSGAWVSAEPAKVLAVLEALGLLSVLPAIEATRGLVFSFFAMSFIPLKRAELRLFSIPPRSKSQASAGAVSRHALRPDSFGTQEKEVAHA